MKPEMFNGLINATSEKRYRHFLNNAADSEIVWMVDCGNDNLLSPEIDGSAHFLAWSEKEFAEYYLKKVLPDLECEIVSIEVHTFCDMLEKNKIMFMIFPTEQDAWVVSSDELYQNIIYELARIEQM